MGSSALRELSGDELNRIPVSSIKGSVGHMLSAPRGRSTI